MFKLYNSVNILLQKGSRPALSGRLAEIPTLILTAATGNAAS